MTLYLKYRPKNLDEIDEVSVSESLKKIVSKKSIPHAFLFAGPKGTGKTSAARILAKIINCENPKDENPCDKCKQCVSITNGTNLDVVEMDAASLRGIDDVRILKDAVKLSPVSGKKRIYIIDEVHMLTTEASNALLKTLEEPPEHVVFILATTNPEKLIETIRSRTTLIPFRKAGDIEIVRSLKRVVEGEKIKIEEPALSVIAEAADGSFRDAIKILEQLVAEEKELTKECLEEFLFKNKSYDLEGFIRLLIDKNQKRLLEEINTLNSKGITIESFIESLMKKLRLSLLSKVGVGEEVISELSKSELVNLIELLNIAFKDMNESPVEELPLEIAVMKWCGEEDTDTQPSSGRLENNPSSDMGETIPSSSHSRMAEAVITLDSASQNLIQTEFSGPPGLTADLGVDDGAWKNILVLVKPINASMEALLRAAKPVAYNGKILTLGVYYKFHKERLEESRHRKILEDVVAKVLKSPTKVNCILVDPPPKKIIDEAKIGSVLTEGKDKDIIEAAEKIFSN